MEKYMISKIENSVNIARYKGDGDYAMWSSHNCQWLENDDNAWGAFIGFEDGFYKISKEEALEVIRQYEQSNG